MPSSFRDRVAIVTGAGGGLGRAHALALAQAGARVVVNDLAPAGLANAQGVVDEIRAAGGTAIAHSASVTDPEAVADMVNQAIATWGRVDILVNNAGILRDKSFAKCTADDFRLVLEVHLMGAFHCCKAVWPHMKEAGYGRIVMTTSVSGLYGNFGQANYAAAKMGMVGLMNTLHIEGQKHDIRVNALAPTAYTQMLEGLVDPAMAECLTPESIAPGLLYLVGRGRAHTRCHRGGHAADRRSGTRRKIRRCLRPDRQVPAPRQPIRAELTWRSRQTSPARPRLSLEHRARVSVASSPRCWARPVPKSQSRRAAVPGWTKSPPPSNRPAAAATLSRST
jgi:NAD(P)-dependent dehydrogenase (short-subunit alcohol dehydrogenase family)